MGDVQIRRMKAFIFTLIRLSASTADARSAHGLLDSHSAWMEAEIFTLAMAIMRTCAATEDTKVPRERMREDDTMPHFAITRLFALAGDGSCIFRRRYAPVRPMPFHITRRLFTASALARYMSAFDYYCFIFAMRA